MQRPTSEGPDAVMERPGKPKPAPELAELGRLLGSWSGSAELVSPAPEAMMDKVPQHSEGIPTSFQGGGTYEWVLGGMFLRGEGWHEMGRGQRIHYLEYIAWDAKAKEYRSWWFSDSGERGQGRITLSEDGRTLFMRGDALDAHGASKSSERRMTFVANNAIEWTWVRDTPAGKMKLKGKSRRSR